MRSFCLALLLTISTAVLAETPAKIHQLRIYEIFEPNKAAFHERFRADEEWIAIKKRTAAAHGQLVGEIQERVLERTPYSPAMENP